MHQRVYCLCGGVLTFQKNAPQVFCSSISSTFVRRIPLTEDVVDITLQELYLVHDNLALANSLSQGLLFNPILLACGSVWKAVVVAISRVGGLYVLKTFALARVRTRSLSVAACNGLFFQNLPCCIMLLKDQLDIPYQL